MYEDADKLKNQADLEQKQMDAETELFKTGDDPNLIGRPNTPDPPEGRANGPTATPEYREAFNRYLVTGASRGLIPAGESRALQVDDDEAGGYITASEQFVNELIKDLDDQVVIRGLAKKLRVDKAVSLGAPKRAAKMSTFAWSTEIKVPTADSALKFAKRNLFPHPLTGEILVSRDLLRQAVISPEAIVRSEMVRDAGETEETAFMTGSGAEQPLGIFTASSDGISTGRDVSTGNTTTAPTFDGLIEAKYTLKLPYWSRARWIAHRDFGKLVAKIKDGEGQYIWRESVRGGEPDRLLGLPLLLSEFAPAVFTTGLYVAILGDFINYWIADAMDLDIQRLMELHARSNQVGFIGRLKTDGAPVVEEAFVRVKLA
jgi:HK97 family phage major capsid protein